jgi:hypothetical protein
MTCDQAIENAARLLNMAEAESNPQLMERYEKIADSWISLAHLVSDRERV